MAFRNQRNFRNNREKRRIDEESEETVTDNPILMEFKKYSKELDARHDRHERLVKMSRDITIEAKRIIFLLHNIDVRKNNKESVLTEAKERIEKLIGNNFAAIAKELKDREIFQFMRAVSPGIQEFIEALTFYEFLAGNKEPSTWEDVQMKMKYKDESEEEYSLFLCPVEFILGYADLTGEVMRHCINSLNSSGEIENIADSSKFLQRTYAKFLTIGSVPNHGRDFSHKLSTMKMSTLKCEHVVYQMKVRGTEGAKFPTSLDFPLSNNDDVDEGFY